MTMLMRPFTVALDSTGSGSQDIGAPAMGSSWVCVCTLDTDTAGQSFSILIGGHTVARGTSQSPSFAVPANQVVSISVKGGAASSDLCGTLIGTVGLGEPPPLQRTQPGSLVEIDLNPADIAVEFPGLAPASIGKVTGLAAPASHTHAMNALGRAVKGFGVAANPELTVYAAGGTGGQKAGWMLATSDPLPALSQWCIEWFGQAAPNAGFNGGCVGWLGAFDTAGGPSFTIAPDLAIAMPTNLVGVSNNGTAAGQGQLTSGGTSGGGGSQFEMLMTSTGWSHYAITSDGKTMRMFIAGQLVASLTAPASVDGPVGFAAQPESISGAVIDEVRVSSTARYTADFTPPSVPFATDQATVLLWHFDDLPLGTEITKTFDVSAAIFYPYLGISADSSGNGHNASFFPGACQNTNGTMTATFGGEVSTVTSTSGVGTAYSVLSLQAQRGDLVLTDTAGNTLGSAVAQADGTIQLQIQKAPSLGVALPANPPVSGTVYQNTSGYTLDIVLAITATVSGTAQWALGPTNTPADFGPATGTIVGTIEKRLTVPPDWYYSLTVTGTATIGTASVLAY